MVKSNEKLLFYCEYKAHIISYETENVSAIKNVF